MAQEMGPSATSEDRPDSGAPTQGESARGAPMFRPLTDIVEHRDGVTLGIEMPGVGADDVEIGLERRVLTVRGRGRLTRPDGFRRVYAEYDEGDYERVFTLSDDVDAENIKATMKDGLLTLELPRAQASKPKQIKVTRA